jgi:hypothetical protein
LFTFDNGPHRERGNDPDFKDRSLPEVLEKPDQQPITHIFHLKGHLRACSWSHDYALHGN